MDSFPLDVLFSILLFLTPRDLYTARLTCKRFYNAYRDKRLWQMRGYKSITDELIYLSCNGDKPSVFNIKSWMRSYGTLFKSTKEICFCGCRSKAVAKNKISNMKVIICIDDVSVVDLLFAIVLRAYYENKIELCEFMHCHPMGGNKLYLIQICFSASVFNFDIISKKVIANMTSILKPLRTYVDVHLCVESQHEQFGGRIETCIEK